MVEQKHFSYDCSNLYNISIIEIRKIHSFEWRIIFACKYMNHKLYYFYFSDCIKTHLSLMTYEINPYEYV